MDPTFPASWSSTTRGVTEKGRSNRFGGPPAELITATPWLPPTEAGTRSVAVSPPSGPADSSDSTTSSLKATVIPPSFAPNPAPVISTSCPGTPLETESAIFGTTRKFAVGCVLWDRDPPDTVIGCVPLGDAGARMVREKFPWPSTLIPDAMVCPPYATVSPCSDAPNPRPVTVTLESGGPSAGLTSMNRWISSGILAAAPGGVRNPDAARK